jgi:Mrp family chromosome partitioning ATPase
MVTDNTSNSGPFSSYIRTPEFRRLLRQLQAVQTSNSASSISIISRFAQEGRSFFTAALAVGFASLLLKRVLVIDTIREKNRGEFPLRSILRRSAGTLFESKSGVIHLLTIEHTKNHSYFYHDPLLPNHATNLPTVLDSSNSSNKQPGFSLNEGNGSLEFIFKDLLTSLKPSYDLILVDTLPLQASNYQGFDPIVVGGQVDGVLILTSPISLDTSILNSLREELNRCNIPIIGTIHNPWVSIKRGKS